VNAIVAVSADDHASESDRNNCAVDHAHGVQPLRLRGGSYAVTRMRTHSADAARSRQLRTPRYIEKI